MQERIIFSLTITVSKSPSQVQYLSLYSWPRQTLKVQFTRLIRSARQIRLVIHQSFLSSSASKVCCKGRLIRITWGAFSTHIYALLLLAKQAADGGLDALLLRGLVQRVLAAVAAAGVAHRPVLRAG